MLEKAHWALILSECSSVGAYLRRALIRDVRLFIEPRIQNHGYSKCETIHKDHDLKD